MDNTEMDKENNLINNEAGNYQKVHCSQICPLSQIPKSVWKTLFLRPFRKRHPVIFWSMALLFIFMAAFCIKTFFADDRLAAGEDSIALVLIEGPIIDSMQHLQWIRKIEQNAFIKGILVRVNSPGGGAAASQEIYAALKRAGAKKPIAVSMGATAASGGLMISMAGEKIFANPSTITGSIGVRMDIPQLQALMEKIGIGQETLVTAPYKDAASFTRPLTPEDRKYLFGVLEDMHNQFVEIVAAGRNMPAEKVKELANGKIYTGQEAKKLGLIDFLGGQDDAHQWLAEKLNIPLERKLAKKPQEKITVLDIIFKSIDLLNMFTGKSTLEQNMLPVFSY